MSRYSNKTIADILWYNSGFSTIAIPALDSFTFMPIPTVNSTTLRGHTGAVNATIFSVDGQYCLTASSDRSIKLWNPLKQALINTYTGHGKEVLGIALLV